MKTKLIKITGYTWLAMILIVAFGFAGCGGNNQELSAEPTEEILPTEEPTEVIIPTEEPTEEVIPTEEPTEEVIPTEEPTEEAIPTEEIVELPPIMGNYAVTGIDPEYNNYEDTLEITASNGIFQWNWFGREPAGIGIFQEDVVSVVWRKEKSGVEACGLISYIVQEDGVLDGIYKEIGSTWVGEEKAMPLGESEEGIEGTYMSVGSTPGGGMYSCNLELTRNGDVYDFLWDCGVSFYGVAIQRGNFVSVAFSKSSPKSCTVFSYLIEEDGTLDGLWVTLGDSELGTDVAVPETFE